jgi:hypothetical protein
MKIEPRRIERSTAVAVTSTINANVAVAGMSFQSAWAAKKVENRIAMPAPVSAFTVIPYRRAAGTSEPTRSAMPTTMPIDMRTAGDSQP